MRLSLLHPALGLAVYALVADLPKFAPAEGSTLVKTIESTGELKSTEVVISIDGEEHSGEEIGDPELGFSATSKFVVSDEYVKMGKGRPKELKRTYDELQNKFTFRQAAGGEDPEESERELKSELTGESVIFKWDEKKSEYAASFPDDKGDSDLLRDLTEDLDFREFLPPEGTAEDASWELEASAVNVILFPCGDLKFKGPDEDDDDDKGEIDRELRESVKGKVTATFKGLREEGKAKFAVIELKADVKSQGDYENDEGAGRAFDVHSELTGEILWDVEGNHVHAVSVEGTDTTIWKRTNKISHNDEDHTFEQRVTVTGPITFKLGLGK